MHRDAFGDPDADGRDLLAGAAVRAGQPHAGTSVDPCPAYAELGEHLDQHALEPAHVGDHVDGIGEPHDRVADQLAGTVPGDLAAAVDVDDRSAVGGALVRFGAFARRVHGRVLQKEDGVWRPAAHDVGVHGTLVFESDRIRHGVGA